MITIKCIKYFTIKDKLILISKSTQMFMYVFRAMDDTVAAYKDLSDPHLCLHTNYIAI